MLIAKGSRCLAEGGWSVSSWNSFADNGGVKTDDATGPDGGIAALFRRGRDIMWSWITRSSSVSVVVRKAERLIPRLVYVGRLIVAWRSGR